MPNGGRAWLLALLAIAVSEACGRSDGSVAPQKTSPREGTGVAKPSGVATRFVGSEWKLSRLHGQAPLNGTNVTLEVDREDGGVLVGGSATCNSYGFRDATMKDGVLAISGGDLTTRGTTNEGWSSRHRSSRTALRKENA